MFTRRGVLKNHFPSISVFFFLSIKVSDKTLSLMLSIVRIMKTLKVLIFILLQLMNYVKKMGLNLN